MKYFIFVKKKFIFMCALLCAVGTMPALYSTPRALTFKESIVKIIISKKNVFFALPIVVAILGIISMNKFNALRAAPEAPKVAIPTPAVETKAVPAATAEITPESKKVGAKKVTEPSRPEALTVDEIRYINGFIEKGTTHANGMRARIDDFFNIGNNQSYATHVNYFAEDLNTIQNELIAPIQHALQEPNHSPVFIAVMQRTHEIIMDLHYSLAHVYRVLNSNRSSSAISVGNALSQAQTTVRSRLNETEKKLDQLLDMVKNTSLASKILGLRADLRNALASKGESKITLLKVIAHRLNCK